MASFPIQYSEAVPSGRSPNVRANIQTNYGVGEAIQAAFNQWGAEFGKIQDAQDMADLSTAKRLFDEKAYAAVNAYKMTGDEAGRKKIIEEWEKDTDTIPIKNNRVGQQFQLYKDNAMPGLGQTFANHEIAIRVNNARDTFKINIEKNLGNGDVGSATADMWSWHLLDPINYPEAKAKEDIRQAPNTSLMLQATKLAPIDPIGAEAILNKVNIKDLSPEGIQKREGVIRDIQFNKTVLKKDNEMAIEAERKTIDDIFTKPQDEFLASVPSALNAINTSAIMPVKDKEEQRKKINDRVNAIKEGKIDPVNEFDPQTYNNLALKARRKGGIAEGEIRDAVGKGKEGGITTDQADILWGIKKKYDAGDLTGKSLHRTYSNAISDLQTTKMFSANKVENIKMAAEAQSVLDNWATKNPDATAKDYSDFYNTLVDTSNLSGWYTFFTRQSKEQRVAIKENLQEMKTEFGGESAYTKDQIINRNGKKYIITGFDTDGEPLVKEVK